jgi:hypothetical protein
VTVTLHVWRIGRSAAPKALWSVAVDRRRLRRTPGVRFAKLLGTGTGSDFGPLAADLTRWAALVVWDDGAGLGGGPYTSSSVQRGTLLSRLAVAECVLTLAPLSSRGAWAGVEPFRPARRRHDGPLLVLTRARLRATRVLAFWRAIDRVAATLPDQPGLLAAFGVGEAPLGLQGTVSVWRGAADLTRFAYRQPEHATVVASTPRQRWYAEELFARFAVLDVAGDKGVIGWREGR